MPNAFETPWVTLEGNDVPLSLCNDLGRPNLGIISCSSFVLFYFIFFSYQVHCIQFRIPSTPLAAISHCKLISNLSSVIRSRSPSVLLLSRFLLSIELFCSRCIGFHFSQLNLILLFLSHNPTLSGSIYITS